MKGSKFKKYREKANISLNTVSSKARYPINTLQLYEKDMVTLPIDQSKMLCEIIDYLKINEHE